jgi:4-hydroxybenzoate polyprenyltransferase
MFFILKHLSLLILLSATILLLILSGYNTSLGIGFNIGMFFATSHLFWQLSNLNINNPENCAKLFRSNKWFGLIVFLAIVLGKATLNSNIE